MNKKKFTYHKITNFCSEDSAWYCLVENDEQFFPVLDHLDDRCVNIYKLIKDSNPNVIGHCGTEESSMIKTLLGLKMKSEGKEEISFEEGLDFVQKIKTDSFINTYARNKKVYISSNGAIRPSTKLLDFEEITDICFSKHFVFPGDQRKYVKVIRWPMGSHFYVTEDGCTLTIDGHAKWNTVTAAEEAKEEYINSHVH